MNFGEDSWSCTGTFHVSSGSVLDHVRSADARDRYKPPSVSGSTSPPPSSALSPTSGSPGWAEARGAPDVESSPVSPSSSSLASLFEAVTQTRIWVSFKTKCLSVNAESAYWFCVYVLVYVYNRTTSADSAQQKSFITQNVQIMQGIWAVTVDLCNFYTFFFNI